MNCPCSKSTFWVRYRIIILLLVPIMLKLRAATMMSRTMLPECVPCTPAAANLLDNLHLRPHPSFQAAIARRCTECPEISPMANNLRSSRAKCVGPSMLRSWSSTLSRDAVHGRIGGGAICHFRLKRKNVEVSVKSLTHRIFTNLLTHTYSSTQL